MTNHTSPLDRSPLDRSPLDRSPNHGVTPPFDQPSLAEPRLDQVVALLAKRTFCTLATTSPDGTPHAAGVMYAWHDGCLYISTLRRSRKAGNIAARSHVYVSVPVRRAPVGPPSTISFPARAEVLACDDAAVVDLAAAGALKAITAHGELQLPGGCILRVEPVGPLFTYGIGLPLRTLITQPLRAGGRVDLGD